jgi:hypothetical protein
MRTAARARRTFRRAYRSLIWPEQDAQPYVGLFFWLSGLACCVYWFLRLEALLLPGGQLNALLGQTSEASDLHALCRGIAIVALSVLIVFSLVAVSLRADKSARESRISRQRCTYLVLHWFYLASNIATLVYVSGVVGRVSFVFATLWDAVAHLEVVTQSAVFALAGFPVSWLLYRQFSYWKRRKPERYTLNGPFRPSTASSFTSLFVAVWYSYLCIYPLMIHVAYENLRVAYEKCKVFKDAVDSDPFLPVDHFSKPMDQGDIDPIIYQPNRNDVDLLHRFLKFTGAIRATVSFDDFSIDSRFAEQLPYFFQRQIINNVDLSKPMYMAPILIDKTSIQFAANVAAKRGHDAAQLSPDLEACIAANLAGSPNCDKQWDLLNSGDGDRSKAVYGIFDIRPIGIPNATSDREIVARLLAATSRSSLDVGGGDGEVSLEQRTESLRKALTEQKAALSATPPAPGLIEEVRVAVEQARGVYDKWDFLSSSENSALCDRILEETLARTHSAPDVKAARFFVAVVQGAEQLGMLVLGTWLMCLLVVRSVGIFRLTRNEEWVALASSGSRRSMSAEQVKAFVTRLFALYFTGGEAAHEDVEARFERVRRVNFQGRWVLRWIAQALPAVGFIGTVRGISAGLGSADAIVRAEGVIGQAAAVNHVAGSLSIAFTTTLIALVFGLVLGILERVEASCEDGILLRLEIACVKDCVSRESD